MSSSKLCDSCKSTPATLFCRADSAFLCPKCDANIHTANKLSLRHERVLLCEVCEQAPAHVTCKADAASLCVTCDRDIHSANPLSRRHERVPVTPLHDDADVSMEAASWLVPKEIPNLFSDLDDSLKIEATSESSFGNDGVVPVQIKSSHLHESMFLNDDYFNFDIAASKSTFPPHGGFTFINNTVDVPLVPESGGVTEVTNTTTGTIAVQLTPAEREARVLRYREKRKNRRFEKTIRYASRKAYAEMRPRIKGRFAKRTDSSKGDGGRDIGVYTGFGVVPSF